MTVQNIYRPFFLAGIATVLTLGCVWGAINLFTIGVKESFSAVSYSWVLAHGHAMVFGFVGFFIMGFAYQARVTNKACFAGRAATECPLQSHQSKSETYW